MQNILLEIQRCKEIEAASKARGLPAAESAYAGRRFALEWAMAQVQAGAAAASAERAKIERAKTVPIKLPK